MANFWAQAQEAAGGAPSAQLGREQSPAGSVKCLVPLDRPNVDPPFGLSMPIRSVCEKCGASFRVDETKAGAVVRCKQCGTELALPGERRRRGASPPAKRSANPWLIWAGVGG